MTLGRLLLQHDLNRIIGEETGVTI
jgi:hypothetical protein